MSSSAPHRYVTPTYPGQGGWDYFNVVSGGVGASGSAYMDGAKVGGPNVGTFAVAFGEDATSSNANRGLRALAQNTDWLDNLLHRPIATKVRTGDVGPTGSPTSSITLPTTTFLGVAGTPSTVAGYNLLFEVLDSNDDEIIDSGSDAKCKVTAVTLGTGDVIGGGGANGNFSGNTVGLTISPSIPTGTTYRVYYGTRTNLADLPLDAFTTISIRGAQEVSATVEILLRELHGNSEGWNANWDSTIYDLAASGLDERYGRNPTASPASPPEAYWPSGVNTAGSGGFIHRTGPALTVYSDNTTAYVDPLNALFATKSNDTVSHGPGGGVSFAAYGSRSSSNTITGETTLVPGFGDYLVLWPHTFDNTTHATHMRTRIQEWGTAAFAYGASTDVHTGEAVVTVTQAGNYFRDGTNTTAVVLGYDLLECIYNGKRQVYVITGFGSVAAPADKTKVTVRCLDGTVPDFGGSPTGTIRWISTSFGVGEGAGIAHSYTHGSGVLVKLDGLFHQVPVYLTNNSADAFDRTAASFSAQLIASNQPAVQWGGFDNATGLITWAGMLMGDGSGAFAGAGVLTNILIASTSITLTGNAHAIQVTGDSSSILMTGLAGVINLTHGNVTADGNGAGEGGIIGNYLITKEQTLSIIANVCDFDTVLGSWGNLTPSANFNAAIAINMTHVRAGGIYVLYMDRTNANLGTAPTLTWGGAGLTHRHSAGDDQPTISTSGNTHLYELWVGRAITATVIAWTLTRY